MKPRAPTDAAKLQLQRLRARALALEVAIDLPRAQSKIPGQPAWTNERVAAIAERALQAIAEVPRAPLLTPSVLAALLVGEWGSARAWLQHVPAEPAERVLLEAAMHAFTGDPAAIGNAPDAAPPSSAELLQQVQAAAAAAASEGEHAVCAFVALVYELLGPAPDAARDRLTLRVELPAGWTTCRARNLRMGDAAFDAAMTHVEDGVRIDVEQTEGALPATLILEATVRAPVARIEIDGRTANLALRPAADHVVVPVQLVLDAPRVMHVILRDT